jgi:putative alpha-1,2-mannosidase
VLNAPRFTKSVLHLENGHDITIKAAGADGSKLQYVSGLKVGSRPSDRVYVGVDQLKRGTTLDFRLTTDAAEATWGTSPSAAPALPCAE